MMYLDTSLLSHYYSDIVFRAIPLTRFTWGTFVSTKKMMAGAAASSYSLSAWKVWLFKLYAGWAFNSRSKGHGIGLHSR